MQENLTTNNTKKQNPVRKYVKYLQIAVPTFHTIPFIGCFTKITEQKLVAVFLSRMRYINNIKHKGFSLYFCILLGSSVIVYADFDSNNIYSYTNINMVVKSASEYDYPPYCIVSQDGKADGFSVELLRATLSAVDRDVEFKTGPWNELKQELKDGTIQVLPLFGRTPEREAMYDFTFPYLSVHGAIFVRKGDKRIKTIDDLADKSVLVMRGDNAEEFARRKNISSNIIAVETYADAIELLNSGKYDAVITQRLMGIQLLNKMECKTVVPLDFVIHDFRQDFCFGVKDGDKELLSLLNEGLSIVIADGTFDKLHAKWFGPLLIYRISFKQLIKYFLIIFIPFAGLSSLLLIFILHREVKNKTKNLRQEIEERKHAEETLKRSEASVRNKLKIILEPEGNIADLDLSDIIDVKVIQSIMEDFYKLTGMLGALLDSSGNVLVAVGWQDICKNFHRCHPESSKNCIESDTILTTDVQPGEFKAYRCKNNMWDMVTPIILGDRHVGNVFIGQFFYEDEEVDVELFKQQAKLYGFDETEYLVALEKVPHFSRETVNACMHFYSKLADIIATQSYSAIKMSRMLVASKNTELALADEKERLAVTLRSIGDGVITTDMQGNVIMLNKAAENLTGWKSDEAAGHPLPDVFNIINEITRKKCENPVEQVLATSGTIKLANHTCLISKNGREIIIADSGAPIRDAEGKIIGVVLVFRDMTEKQKLDESIQKTQKLESLGILAGGIAHDFNNLLGGIFGYIELALQESTETNVSTYLAESLSNVERARALTQQLLTFAKGGAPIKKLETLFPFVDETVQFALSGTSVSSISDVQEGLWLCEFDKNQIAQVIDNISINAQQAMPNGGTIEVSAKNVIFEEHSHPSLAAGKYIKLSFKRPWYRYTKRVFSSNL
ncbi:MAG: PocR ligand-binding domain-containing protein [Kiritimatiellae bacterium]|jgi:PAS domain S-box-containing protein|nr:PocR ligand-binding domain-containing protein [Kiritimatiellia bacterium]